MDGVILTPLKQISNPKGDVFHAMKCTDTGFNGFGEAYFSSINEGDIKGWKKHNAMTLNLVVICGEIEFVIYNENTEDFFEVILSHENYQRLTIFPGIWVAFRGLNDKNMLLNLANLPHDPLESENIAISEIYYEW